MADATPYFLTLWPTLDLNGTLGASESVMGGSTMSFASWREQAVLQYCTALLYLHDPGLVRFS
jgi:hypothetical protein